MCVADYRGGGGHHGAGVEYFLTLRQKPTRGLQLGEALGRITLLDSDDADLEPGSTSFATMKNTESWILAMAMKRDCGPIFFAPTGKVS